MLTETVASRQVVAVACELARARSVRTGMTLAEARAVCPGLEHGDYHPDKDLKALEALARWMTRFSPTVAVEPPDALLLDVTGSERLFGGMDRLARRASEALVRLNLGHGIAIAPTPGSAWAFASFGNAGPRVVTPEQVPGALAPLPVEALRLERGLADAFAALGVETVGQLMRLPRESLPARFGLTVLTRLDQALGRSPEPLTPVECREPIVARIDFDGVIIDSLETIWLVLQRLLGQVLAELGRRGCGARKIFADYLLPRASPVRKTIQLSRPSCDAAALFNLLRCATETVKEGDGFAGLCLSVPVFERLTGEQLQLLGREAQAAEAEMGHLIERLRVRLGEGAVLFARLVESHLPEKAFKYAEAGNVPASPLAASPKHASACHPERSEGSLLIRSQETLRCAQGDGLTPSSSFSEQHRERGEKSKKKESPTVTNPPPRPRPLHLLPAPLEVRCTASPSGEGEGMPVSFTFDDAVFQVARCAGPERISGAWWEGRDKTRDYYDVEDPTGRRFWVFRVAETRRWYLQGVFDG